MKKLCALSVCFLTLLTVTACGPIYKTEYSFSAPPTQTGKVCANHCLDARQACFHACSAKEDDCRDDATTDAKLAYLEYANTRLLRDQEVDKTLKDFESDSHCYSTSCDARCNESHRICHTNCGGYVSENKVCTAFCG